MNGKGFVISFDAIVALLLLFALLVAASTYLGKVGFNAGNSLSLKEITTDSLAVLEKNGDLDKAIRADRAADLRAFLNKLPYSICADLRVYSEGDMQNHSFLVLRQGCKKSSSDFATASRSIAVRNGDNVEFYLAELRAWYRVSSQ